MWGPSPHTVPLTYKGTQKTDVEVSVASSPVMDPDLNGCPDLPPAGSDRFDGDRARGQPHRGGHALNVSLCGGP